MKPKQREKRDGGSGVGKWRGVCAKCSPKVTCARKNV